MYRSNELGLVLVDILVWYLWVANTAFHCEDVLMPHPRWSYVYSCMGCMLVRHYLVTAILVDCISTMLAQTINQAYCSRSILQTSWTFAKWDRVNFYFFLCVFFYLWMRNNIKSPNFDKIKQYYSYHIFSYQTYQFNLCRFVFVLKKEKHIFAFTLSCTLSEA